MDLGVPFQITWDQTDGNVEIYLSRNGKVDWELLDTVSTSFDPENPTQEFSYEWTPDAPASTDCYFRFIELNTSNTFDSDQFAIESIQPLSCTAITSEESFGSASLTLSAVNLSPSSIDSSEVFGSGSVNFTLALGSLYTIRWDQTDGDVQIDISYDNQLSWSNIDTVNTVFDPENPEQEFTYDWTVSGIESDECLIRLTELDSSEVIYSSPFSIILSEFILFTTSINSTETFGTPGIAVGVVSLSPSSITSLETFGDSEVDLSLKILAASSIESLEAVNSPSLSLGSVSLSTSSISSLESFGNPEVSVGYDLELIAIGIESTEFVAGNLTELINSCIPRIYARFTSDEVSIISGELYKCTSLPFNMVLESIEWSSFSSNSIRKIGTGVKSSESFGIAQLERS